MPSLGLIVLLLLQPLCAAGSHMVGYFGPMAEWATRVSQDQVNQNSIGLSLYRVSSTSLQGVTQVGWNMYDLQLNFDIRETVCPKGFEQFLDRCSFRHDFVEASCSSHVRVVLGSVTELRSLSCIKAAAAAAAPRLGSSSSSSEEDSILQRLQRRGDPSAAQRRRGRGRGRRGSFSSSEE